MMSRRECLDWEMICGGRTDDAFEEITAAIVTVSGVKMVLMDKTRQHKICLHKAVLVVERGRPDMDFTGQMGIVRREQGSPRQNLSASGGKESRDLSDGWRKMGCDTTESREG